MKKFILIFLSFLCFSFINNTASCISISSGVKQGIYTISDLNLSPNTNYTVQNNSFNERAFISIFDSKPNLIQFIRLTPQSKKYNLKLLEEGYTLLILGQGGITFTKERLR